MVKELTKNLPDFLKANLGNVAATLTSLEKDARDAYDKLASQSWSRADLKKRLSAIRKTTVSARKDVEKVLNDGMSKAYGVFNIPTKSDVDKLARQVSKVHAEVRKLAGTAGGKPAAPKKKAAKPKARRKTSARKTAKKS
ncbi:MAG: phasin family protein [Deltaproteobacteria bacterium]|nr:phasin family protein [Deltaproteobacteria bacterium]